MSYIPQFEFGKESYILKNKLGYNTICRNHPLSGETYGILFTDYNIARKTKSSNAEIFFPLTISEDLSGVTSIKLTHYNESFSFIISNRYQTDDILFINNTGDTSTSITGSTFINERTYQEFYFPPSDISLFAENDIFNFYFYIKEMVSGTTIWEHIGPSGQTWVATGTTENGIPYQVTGVTTEDGFSTGVADWMVEDIIPIIKYQTKITGIGDDYIKTNKILEDYIINNIISLSKDRDVYYKLESLKFADTSYFGIKYILEETKWNNYFTISATSDSLTITPIINIKDLYFDYDNLEITLFTTSSDYVFNFFTNCVYVRYKLDLFLEQFGFNSGDTIYYDNIINISGIYNGDIYFSIEVLDENDLQYLNPFTYVYVTGQISGEQHICLITEINGNVITLLSARIGMIEDDNMISIQNMHTIDDISKMLYECFINIEGDFEITVFYDANLYDSNINGPNVLDTNLDTEYLFDPRTMIISGETITTGSGETIYFDDNGDPYVIGSDILELFLSGSGSTYYDWYIDIEDPLLCQVTPSSGNTDETITISILGTPPISNSSSKITFKWSNDNVPTYEFNIVVTDTYP